MGANVAVNKDSTETEIVTSILNETYNQFQSSMS